MTVQMVAVCKGCPDRYPKCHAVCNRYLQARADYDRIKATEDEIRNSNTALDDIAVGKHLRLKKRYGR